MAVVLKYSAGNLSGACVHSTGHATILAFCRQADDTEGPGSAWAWEDGGGQPMDWYFFLTAGLIYGQSHFFCVCVCGYIYNVRGTEIRI